MLKKEQKQQIILLCGLNWLEWKSIMFVRGTPLVCPQVIQFQRLHLQLKPVDTDSKEALKAVRINGSRCAY